MTLVRIIHNWVLTPFQQTLSPFVRQTPGHKGIWDGIKFTLEPVPKSDYVIVCNHVPEDTTVQCPPSQIWAIMMEPPDKRFKPMHGGNSRYHHVYTQDTDLQGGRYILSHPPIPWQVRKDYDYLKSSGVPRKEHNLSWITSSLAVSSGHRARLRFLERIRSQINFDLFGRGFVPIADKWDGLAPYKYSLAIENFQNPYYWTEKITDCLLAWTMPIYYGCNRIHEYFSPDAVVQIDIDDPMAIEKIRETICSNRWARNLDAIAHARMLILERYQFFPFFADEIRKHENTGSSRMSTPRTITIYSEGRRLKLLRYVRWIRRSLSIYLRKCLKQGVNCCNQ